MAIVSPPYALGAAGQVLSARLLRLSMGGLWTPTTAANQIRSGIIAGPPNTQGELSLAGTTLTVQAFRGITNPAGDTTAGPYEVINDAPVNFTLTAQHATQFRRSLVVARVDDSQVAGVASSPTTDRATLEVLDGPLATSAGAATLPTIPGQAAIQLGEVLIPPVGQTITLTPYNPRTGVRHGILPIVADGSTTAGHDGDAPRHDGQYRHHPIYGLQVGVGGAWLPGGGSAKPTLLPLISGGVWTHYNIAAGGYENVYLTQVGREIRIRGLMRVSASVAVNEKYTIVAAGGIPTSARPTGAVLRAITCFQGNVGSPERVDVLTDGSITIGNFAHAYTAPWLASWDLSWNIENQPAT